MNKLSDIQDTKDLLLRITQAVEKLAGINDNEDREWELKNKRDQAAIRRDRIRKTGGDWGE